MKTLIVYESDHGQAARVAEKLSAALSAEGHEVTLARAASNPKLDGFGAVVVGGSVRIGKHQDAVVAFCTRHREALQRLPNALFSVSLSARRLPGRGQREVAKIFGRFISDTGWTPQRLLPVAGALRYPRYPLWIKAMLVAISLLTGGDTDTAREYEYTDWPAVERFGRELGRALLVQPEPRARVGAA